MVGGVGINLGVMLEDLATAAILEMLEQGQLNMEGLVPWGSNYTFLIHIDHEKGQIDAIYKPSRGERPLWDFARGTLALRERAAYLTSNKLGWDLVPPTVLRDGPHGWGSVQYFVDHDPQQHYLTLLEGQNSYGHQIQRIALFDAIINNADRKSGHVLLGDGGKVWAIDHGVCFHADPKLRTVIWEFAGETIPEELMDALVAFNSWVCYGNDPVYDELSQLLAPVELQALRFRLAGLIETGTFPYPGPGRHYPWPLV